ncbi:MAG: phosphotransferase [Caldilineaceae bacterium]
MHAHPYFDLLLHDNAELATMLGEPIAARETLHEWPLSCVQQLTLASGRTLIYKAQFGPTREPAFYATARSPLLIQAQTVWRQGEHVCMVMEKAPGQPLHSGLLTEEQAVALGQQLIGQIQKMKGDPPAYMDVSDASQWQNYVQAVARTLRDLVASARFSQTPLAAIDHLVQAAQQPAVIEAMRTGVGYVHGDLAAENIIVHKRADAHPDKRADYYVIDWQRPLRGPTALDLYRFLTSLGHAPHPYCAPGLRSIDRILHIGWLTECAALWFQAGASGYDNQIAQLIEELGSRN